MVKYEVIEGDHWKHVSTWDTLEEAEREAARLNAEHNRDYFVQYEISGEVYSQVP